LASLSPVRCRYSLSCSPGQQLPSGFIRSPGVCRSNIAKSICRQVPLLHVDAYHQSSKFLRKLPQPRSSLLPLGWAIHYISPVMISSPTEGSPIGPVFILPDDRNLPGNFLAHISPLPSLGLLHMPRKCCDVKAVPCPYSPIDLCRVDHTDRRGC